LTRIAICTPDVADNDAVSNDVLGMTQILSEEQFETRIFAANVYMETVSVEKIESIMDFLRDPEDILIYHHSVGWDTGLEVLNRLHCHKVIKYHNVTPSRFFKDIAENYFVACEAGRKHLSEIIKSTIDLYLADSVFNLQEIIDLSSNPIEGTVVPPFHKIDLLQEIEPNPSIFDRFGDGKANFLMVGRIAPNKGLEHLIDVFNVYHKVYNPKSRLLIVGKADPALDAYNRMLCERVKGFDLHDAVFFLGEVSIQELKACYAIADAFTITSLHEGFCVPLVEAMSMGIPIVGYATTAIAETASDVGLVWREHDPELLAASMNMIRENDTVRRSLGRMGQRRYRALFDNAKIRKRLLSALSNADLIPK